MLVEAEIPAMQMGVAMHSVIDFSDIKEGFSVRVTNEIPPRASLIDLTMLVCNQSRDYASQIYRRLPIEVRAKCTNLKFPGPGQKNTPVGTASECTEYIMMLPGNGAKDFRVKWPNFLTRVFARDATLHAEIEANAVNIVPGFGFIDFSGIPGGGSVRVTNETPPRVSMIDLIRVMCDKDVKAAQNTYNYLKKEVADFFSHCENFQFPGERQRNTPVVTASQAIELVWYLPGKKANDFKKKAADILTRFFAGDTTLIPEIETNAVNMDPMSQFCRAEVDVGRVIENTAHVAKRQKLQEDMEICTLERNRLTLECEMEELKRKKQEAMDSAKYGAMAARDAAMTASTTAAFTHVQSVMEWYKKLQPAGGDKRVALVMSDYVDNAMLMQMSGTVSGGHDNLPMITNGGPITPCTDNTPITISGFLVEQGVCDKDGTLGKALGAKMARRYREEYGEDPAKHQQNVGGAYRPVNSYTKKHEYMLMDELQALLAQRSAEDDKRARQPTMDAFCRKK